MAPYAVACSMNVGFCNQQRKTALRAHVIKPGGPRPLVTLYWDLHHMKIPSPKPQIHAKQWVEVLGSLALGY